MRILREVLDRFFHSDGDIRELLPVVFDGLGADGLNPIVSGGYKDFLVIRRRLLK